jgi:hypothetical protein
MTEVKEVVLDSEFFKDFFSSNPPKSLNEVFDNLPKEQKKEFKAFTDLLLCISKDIDPHQLVYHKECLKEYRQIGNPREIILILGKIFSSAMCSREIKYVKMRGNDWSFFEDSPLSSKKYFIESANQCNTNRSIISTNSFCENIDCECNARLLSLRIAFIPISNDEGSCDDNAAGYQ